MSLYSAIRSFGRIPTEQEECKWLHEWAHVKLYRGIRLSHLLISIPNGAYHGADRKTGAVVARKLAEAGLRAGTFDYFLAVPCKRLEVPGLWLEMKRLKGGVVSDAQKDFEYLMIQMGYATQIATGWKHASECIERYLDLCGEKPTPIGNQKPRQRTPP